MKYVITYEHLEEDLVTSPTKKWHFEKVKDSANKYKLELSDEDFKHLFKLQVADKDMEWMMHKMSAYNMTFTETLVSYVTC